MKFSLALLALGLTLGMVDTALAHHSFAAEFDGNKPIRIQGALSKIEWTNPHSWFYVDTKDDSGKVVTWGCEGASPVALSRQGFQKGAAKLGDALVVDGYQAKDGSHFMNARRVYLNGKLVFEQKQGEGQ
jgi:Family of unknown function (DUF6152)